MDAHYIPVMEEYDEIEREIDSLNDDLHGAMEVSSATVANVSTNQSAPADQLKDTNNTEPGTTPDRSPKRHVKNSATVVKTGDGADPAETNASSTDDIRDSRKIGADPNKFTATLNKIISIISNLTHKTVTNIRRNTMLLLRNHKTLDAEIHQLTANPPLQNVTVRNWTYDDKFFANAIRVLKKTANDYHGALRSIYDQFESVPTMDADVAQQVDPETGRPAKRQLLITGQAPMHDDLVRYLCDATGVDQVPGTQEFMKIVRDTYRGGNAPQERTLTDDERMTSVRICMEFSKDMKVLTELTDRFATIANVFKSKCHKMIQIATDMDDTNRKVVAKEMQKISKNLNTLCTLNKFYVTLFTERSVNAEMVVRAAYTPQQQDSQQQQQTNQQVQEQQPQQEQQSQEQPQEQQQPQ